MIKFKQKDNWFNIIVPEIPDTPIDLNLVVNSVNYASYKFDSRNHYLINLEKFNHKNRKSKVPTYIGIHKKCIYIKDSFPVNGKNLHYQNQLEKLFQNFKLVTIFGGNDSLSIRVVQNYEVVLDIMKTVNTDVSRVQVAKIGGFQPNDGFISWSDDEFITKMNNLLYSLTGNNSLEEVKLEKYVLANLNELLLNSEYSTSFNKHFPNLNKTQIYSAWVAAEERQLVSDEQKLLLYPSKKDLFRIIGNTIGDCLDLNLKVLKSGTLKYKNSQYGIEIYQGGNRAGDIEITMGLKFIEVEKYLKQILKDIGNDIYRTDLFKYFYLKEYFRGIISYDSYNAIATKVYWRVKLIEEEILPKMIKLTKYNNLNVYLNYDLNKNKTLSVKKKYNDKLRKGPQFENPIVAILASDPDWELILKREVIEFVDDKEEILRIEQAYEQMKNSI
jgi:hypothetical protein